MAPDKKTVVHVTESGGGAQDGSTWSNAFRGLQAALQVARSGYEIWVAQGTYRPTDYGDRAASFRLVEGVEIYGGFVGNELLRDWRDWNTNPTMLSGDLGSSEDTGLRSFHVVTGKNLTAATVVDGFVITGGNANGDPALWQTRGGGVYCDGRRTGNDCSPTFRNTAFRENHALYGGAIYNDGSDGGRSSPTLSNVVFEHNSAEFDGGAMYNDGSGNDISTTGNSRPVLVNADFVHNNARDRGGALFNNGFSGDASPVVTHAEFVANRAATMGGAVASISPSSPVFTDVVFSTNAAGLGGAVHSATSYDGKNNPTFTNVTLYGNAAAERGGAIYLNGGSFGECAPMLTNTILWNNHADADGSAIVSDNATPTISCSIVQGGLGGGGLIDGGHNIDQDPLLVGQAEPRATHVHCGLAFEAGSPAIGHGSAAALPSDVTGDRAGYPLVYGHGVADIGAYHGQPRPRIVVAPRPDALSDDCTR